MSVPSTSREREGCSAAKRDVGKRHDEETREAEVIRNSMQGIRTKVILKPTVT